MDFSGFQKFSAHIDFDEDLDIDSVYQISTILSWLYQGPVGIEIFVRQKSLTEGSVSVDKSNIIPQWVPLEWSLKYILEAIPSARWPKGELFNIRYIFSILDGIVKFARLISGEKSTLCVKLEEEVEIDDLIGVKKIVFSSYVQISGVILFMVFRSNVIIIKKSTDSINIDMGGAEILKKYALIGGIQDNFEYLSGQLSAVFDKELSENTIYIDLI